MTVDELRTALDAMEFDAPGHVESLERDFRDEREQLQETICRAAHQIGGDRWHLTGPTP